VASYWLCRAVPRRVLDETEAAFGTARGTVIHTIPALRAAGLRRLDQESCKPPGTKYKATRQEQLE
jgi:hypothetical protein